MPRAAIFAVLILASLMAGSLAWDQPDTTSAGGVPYTVTSTADPGDANCFTNGCTLREAINLANTGQGNSIEFNLPGCPGADINCTIEPAAELPPIDQPFTSIRGASQPGFAGEPIVHIKGNSAGAANGLVINQGEVHVSNLLIDAFQQSGVLINTSQAGIVIESNVIGENGFDGITLGGGAVEVSHNFIAANGQAGIDGEACSDGSEFLSNDIVFHPTAGHAGLQVCGENNTARYNRFIDNVVGIDDLGFPGSLDAEANWFGCNEGPGAVGCDSVVTSGTIQADPWLVLTIEASPTVIAPNETSTIIARLTRNSDGGDTSAFGQVRDGGSVMFATDLGTIGSSSVLKTMVNGSAEATLTAPPGPGVAHVTAEHTGETVQVDVTITETAETPTPSPTPTPTPTATPTPTGEPTLTPTPTATPDTLIWGDNNCADGPNPVDGLLALRFDAGLETNTGDCPEMGEEVDVQGFSLLAWGDVDCNGTVDPVDGLKLLRFDAGLSVDQEEGCPEIGDEVTVA